MSHIFVSYSQKNKPIALALKERLEKTGKEVWLDLHNLPASVEWWKEIQQSIAEADAFVYLVSVESIASEYCQREVEKAREFNKRIFPILLDGVSEKGLSQEISKIQFLRWGYVETEEGFGQLLTNIDKDHEWVRFHTDLVAKAYLWDKKKRDPSHLIRGKVLEEAETELAQSQKKDPKPADLQREFVLASRNDQTRGQRRIIGGLSVFSILILLLFFVVLQQLNKSRALQLGAQAQIALANGNDNLAWLYAYQSNLIQPNDAVNQVQGYLLEKEFVPIKALLDASEAAWSPDGKKLALVSEYTDIIIWDLATGKPLQTLTSGRSALFRSVAWSADGRLASSRDEYVIIWDLATGKPAQTLIGHNSFVSSISWSADGRLASGAFDNTVIIWDLATGKPTQTLTGHTDFVSSVAWSADGRLASGSGDGTIIIWDLAMGKPAQMLTWRQANGVHSVAWSVDGRLASGAYQTVIIWDLVTGKPAQTLTGHADAVSSVAWSADGRLVSGSSDKTVIIWDLAMGKPAQTLAGHNNYVSSVAWSSDGYLFSVSDDDTVIVWDLVTVNRKPAQTLTGHNTYINSVAWSSDGRLASGAHDGTVIVWNLATGKPAQFLKGHTALVTSVAWSSDGRLASGSDDGTVIIWDLATGKPAQTITGQAFEVNSLAWSSDGRLASGGSWSVIIWDLSTGRPAQTIHSEIGKVTSLAWSADGRLASGAYKTVIIWDLVTGKPAQTLTGHTDFVSSVAWSADGRLASGSGDDGTVIIWNLATGKPAQTITGYTDYVNSVAWSADGRLASGSGALDKAVIIWDLEMGKPSQKIKGHAGSITSVAWSPDGRLASGSWDKTIRIARTDVLFHNPCNWVFRNMTLSEWVSTQGIFFVYQPACPNLPTPSWTEAQTLTELLITWQGRVIFLLAGIVLIAIVGGLLWASYKLALRLRGKKDAGLKKILSIVGLGCSVILLLAFLAAIVIVAIALVQAG